MKAQRSLGLALSWPRLTAVFLVDILILLLASHSPQSWQGDHHVAFWVGVGLAVVITLISLVSYHGITLTSAWAAWVWDWSADPGATLASGCTPPLDHKRRFGRDTVGVREYDGQLVSVIVVDAGEDDGSGRHRHRHTSGTLMVEAVAGGLRQFDIHLDAIDIVSVKIRRGGNAAELSKLDKLGPEEWGLVSDQPASYLRHTWLVLRMNPQLNVAAVTARDSLASTLVAATERIAHDLDGQNCAARPLTADELAEVDSTVLANLEPTWSRPGWRHLKHFNGFATSLAFTPSDITTETLNDLWLSETEATVLTLRLTNSDRQPQVSAWVRYHTDRPLSKEISAGLNRLTGRQLAAVRASLPAPASHSLLTVPSRGLLDQDELILQVGHLQESAASAPAQ